MIQFGLILMTEYSEKIKTAMCGNYCCLLSGLSKRMNIKKLLCPSGQEELISKDINRLLCPSGQGD
jgi:hypothetical protein